MNIQTTKAVVSSFPETNPTSDETRGTILFRQYDELTVDLPFRLDHRQEIRTSYSSIDLTIEVLLAPMTGPIRVFPTAGKA